MTIPKTTRFHLLVISCVIVLAGELRAQQDASELIERSKVAYRQGDVSASVELLHLALKESPEHPEALHLLAAALLVEEDYEQARAVGQRLRAASAHDPDVDQTLFLIETRPRVDRFVRCQEAGAYDCSLRIAREIVDLYPEDPTGYALYGLALVIRDASGDLHRGGSALHQAIQVQEALAVDSGRRLPDNVMSSVYSGLGVCYSRFEDFTAAEGYFRRALEIDPGLPGGQENLRAATELRVEAESRPSEAQGSVRWMSLNDIKDEILSTLTHP